MARRMTHSMGKKRNGESAKTNNKSQILYLFIFQNYWSRAIVFFFLKFRFLINFAFWQSKANVCLHHCLEWHSQFCVSIPSKLAIVLCQHKSVSFYLLLFFFARSIWLFANAFPWHYFLPPLPFLTSICSIFALIRRLSVLSSRDLFSSPAFSLFFGRTLIVFSNFNCLSVRLSSQIFPIALAI